MNLNEENIRQAILSAKEKGILIKGGACFSWDGDRIVACNALGACLIAAGLTKEKDWIPKLGTNLSWVHRFILGFDQGFQVQFLKKDNLKEILVDDSISKMGIRLAKEFRD